MSKVIGDDQKEIINRIAPEMAKYVDEYDLSFYGVQEESAITISLTALTFERNGHKSRIVSGSANPIRGLIKPSLFSSIDGRYQVIVIEKYNDAGIETAYGMIKDIKYFERDQEETAKKNTKHHPSKSTGISVIFSKPPKHYLSHEITKQVLMNDGIREPFEEAKFIYGSNAERYNDGKLKKIREFLPTNPTVIEVKDEENKSQYFTHQLFDKNFKPKLVGIDESELNGDTIIIPTSEESDYYKSIKKKLKGKEVITLSDI